LRTGRHYIFLKYCPQLGLSLCAQESATRSLTHTITHVFFPFTDL
jgi:hypothetical protein